MPRVETKSESQEQPQQQEEKKPPIEKFSAGGVRANVWENIPTSGKGKFYTVSFERRYKANDKPDDWGSTTTMRINDLPKLAVVIDEAYRFLLTKRD